MNKYLAAAYGAALIGLAPNSYANLVLPSAGNSELVLIMYDDNALSPTSTGTGSNFVMDLGLLINDFNSNISYTYNLAGNTVYTDWLSKLNSPGLSFMVAGAFGSGPNSSRIALTSSTANATLTTITNSTLGTVTSQLNGNFLQNVAALPATVPDGSVRSTHNTLTDGSSYQMATAGGSSYSNFGNLWVNQGFRGKMVPVGQSAEFFRVTASSNSAAGNVVIQDFFSNVETPTNLGGFWTFASNTLSYTAAPVIAPVPEPGEWAMLLAGLGLVGFVAKRRKQKSA